MQQAQHDYLQGNYPVVREDAAQMCALQMQAEAGPTLLDQPDGLEPYLEKFIVKQVTVMLSPTICCLVPLTLACGSHNCMQFVQEAASLSYKHACPCGASGSRQAARRF